MKENSFIVQLHTYAAYDKDSKIAYITSLHNILYDLSKRKAFISSFELILFSLDNK